MKRAKQIYEAIEDWTAGLLIVGGLGLMLIGVIMRYFVGKPMSNVLEVSVYIIVWGILIGCVVALRDNEHIRVDILYQLLPERAQKVMNVFSNVVGFCFALFLFVYGIIGIFLDQNSVYKMNLTSLGIGITLWKVYMIVPVIGVMLMVRFIFRIIRIIRGLPESDADLTERADLP